MLPDASMLTLYMLRKATGLVEGLVVHPERALATLLDGSHGLVFSQSVLLALVRGGLDRDAAYRIVPTRSASELDFARIFDRLIIGPTPYGFPIQEALVAELKKAGVAPATAENSVFISGIRSEPKRRLHAAHYVGHSKNRRSNN